MILAVSGARPISHETIRSCSTSSRRWRSPRACRMPRGLPDRRRGAERLRHRPRSRSTPSVAITTGLRTEADARRAARRHRPRDVAHPQLRHPPDAADGRAGRHDRDARGLLLAGRCGSRRPRQPRRSSGGEQGQRQGGAAWSSSCSWSSPSCWRSSRRSWRSIIQLAVSRQREYLADASAVELTRYPQGLANALRKIDADPPSCDDANRGTAHLFIANPDQEVRTTAPTPSGPAIRRWRTASPGSRRSSNRSQGTKSPSNLHEIYTLGAYDNPRLSETTRGFPVSATGAIGFAKIMVERQEVGRTPPDMRGRQSKMEASALSFWYGPTQALHEISMTVPENSVTALIGPSGCGKSTFLRTLNRMNDLIDGVRGTRATCCSTARTSTAAASTWSTCAGAWAWCFRSRTRFPRRSSRTWSSARGSPGIRRSRPSLHEIVERCLQRAALWDEVKDRLDDSALDLSGGQQQRLCIARALATEPGSAADGRAGLRPRPGLHRPHRGPDLRAEAATTPSSSSRTTCSRRPASPT